MSGSTDWLSFHGSDNRIPADERVLRVDARERASSERMDRRVDEHEGHAHCQTIAHRQENQHTDNASRVDVHVLIVFRFLDLCTLLDNPHFIGASENGGKRNSVPIEDSVLFSSLRQCIFFSRRTKSTVSQSRSRRKHSQRANSIQVR